MVIEVCEGDKLTIDSAYNKLYDVTVEEVSFNLDDGITLICEDTRTQSKIFITLNPGDD